MNKYMIMKYTAEVTMKSIWRSYGIGATHQDMLIALEADAYANGGSLTASFDSEEAGREALSRLRNSVKKMQGFCGELATGTFYSLETVEVDEDGEEVGMCYDVIASAQNEDEPTKEDEAEELACEIRSLSTWDMDLLERLCEMAGIVDEWRAADDESFEAVAQHAADILGVDIY